MGDGVASECWGLTPPKQGSTLLQSDESSPAACPRPIRDTALYPPHQCPWGPHHYWEGSPFTWEEGSPLFGKTSEERGNDASGHPGGSVG